MSVTIFVYLFFVPVFSQFEEANRKNGQCVLLNDCDYAIDALKSRQRPQHCGFKNLTPIVCCPREGEKIQKQCSFYYPEPVIKQHKFVVGGVQSLPLEYPHMAILGYGNAKNIQWLCGGSLISDNFILTAAHCIDSREFGPVKWVRLGDLDISNTTDHARPQNFQVLQTFIHPQYKSTSYYHDIALIKLNRKVEINIYVKPACLYIQKLIPNKLIAIGWGKKGFLEDRSSHLMKVELNHIKYEECVKKYSAEKKLQNGIINDWQICAGDEEKDTCSGDSGGPLQWKKTGVPSFYYVVGVTSFGKACGIGNSVGVYTRVANYIDWIEDIVWP